MAFVFSKSKRLNTWIVALSAIPILIFFYTFFQYVANIPFQDDYDALLEPVTKFIQQRPLSWSEFVNIVWTQDDERRIVLDRIAAIGEYMLTGTLNLRLHTFLGLLSLLGILYIVYTIIRGAKIPAVWLLISALLLFHIQYYEAIFWPMIPLQHIIVYFFALLSAYHLYSSRLSHFSMAVLAALLAILSDVSGTFVLPAGLLLLLLQHRWKHAVIWSLFVGGLTLLYYYQLEVPVFRPKLSDNIQHPDQILNRFLVGSGLSFDANTALPRSLQLGLIMGVGAILWAIVIYYFIKLVLPAFNKTGVQLTRWETALWGGIFQFGITILALAVGRATEGVDSLLISRYKHIGFIWLILVLLLTTTKLKPAYQPLFSKVWLGISVLICLFSYIQYIPPLDYYYKERYTDMYDWQHNRAIPSSPIYISIRPAVDSIMLQSIRAGVYQLPTHYFFDGPYTKASEPIALKFNPSSKHSIEFINTEFVRKSGKDNGAFIVLTSATEQYILPTKQKRYSVKSFLLSGGRNYYASGFSYVLSAKYLKSGETYAVSVLVLDGDKKIRHPPTAQIEFVNNRVLVAPL